MGTTIIYLIISMAFSAYFSGMEIAFVQSNKLRFEMEKNENNGFINRIISMFYKNSNNFISTMLVGNNIALVVYGILMARIIDNFIIEPLGWEKSEFVDLTVQTILSTAVILVTGEFIPKTLFKINPNNTLRIFALPTWLFYIILYPISRFSTGLAHFFIRLSGTKIEKEKTNKAFSKIDLDNLIQTSIEDKGEEEVEDEVLIFQNALDFADVKIRDCMVPRTEIWAVEDNVNLEDLKAKFIESGKSKLIVYKDNIDNIIGYIHSAEMFRIKDENWQELIRELPIVPETMAGHKLMKIFIQSKKSLAVVVDEFGGTAGIVSLEDLVEEIIGDIEDEHDTSNYIAKEIGEKEYLLSARLEIEKVNEMFNLDLPESENYMTVGGLILNEYQSFPKLHEVITIKHFQFRILKVTSTKIELVKLKVLS